MTERAEPGSDPHPQSPGSTATTGTPCGLRLRGADSARAAAFYPAVLGWTPEAVTASIDAPLPGVTGACWLTYLAVAELTAAVRAVTAAGGTVLETPGGGRAVVRDATGSPLGLWQAGTEPVGEPGPVFFSEVGAHDGGTAQAFYAAVFGFDLQDEAPDGFSHTELRIDGRTVAALYVIGTDLGADYPPHWMPYISVPDTDAAASIALERGAVALRKPMDTPFGRMCTLRDPEGAAFSLMSAAG